MLFLDDTKWAIDVMLHPGKATTKTMDSIEAFIRYYKASFLPLLIAVAIEILLAGVLAAAVAALLNHALTLLVAPVISFSPYYGNLLAAALAEIVGTLALVILILGTIFFAWVAVPINLFFWSIVYFVIGRWLLKIFNTEYDNTATAFVYSAAPFAVFSWVIALPILGLVIVSLLVAWQFVILVYALANQHEITKKMAGLLILVTGILGFIVGFFLTGI